MGVSTRSGVLGHRGLWAAGLGQILALLAFVALIAVVAPALPAGLAGTPLVLAGVAVALVPALIWMAFFYQQDRLEPEPKTHIIQVFVLGALLAQAIGVPLVKDVFGIDRWLYTTTWSHLLGSILVVGFVQEFLIFAAVRFSIYNSREFNERVDGVIYATVAALGFATLLNFDYVVSRGGVDLTVGVIRVTVTALAHASIAGILGYCLGQAKFEHTPAYYLPGGMVLVAILNGLFFWLQDLVNVRGLSFNPLLGLGLAVVVALILLAVVFWLIRRAIAESIAVGQVPQQAAEGGPA